MPYCGFCGKLCPSVPGLNRHIDNAPNCKKSSHEEFGQYANSIWDEVPENLDNMERQPLPNLPIEPDLPDFHLEEDIQIADETFNREEPNVQLPPPPLPPQRDEPQPRPQHATLGDIPDNETVIDGRRYIENSLRNIWLALHGGIANHCMNTLMRSRKGREILAGPLLKMRMNGNLRSG